MRMLTNGLIVICALSLIAATSTRNSASQVKTGATSLDPDKLELRNVKAERVNYEGRSAVLIKDDSKDTTDDANRFAVVPGIAIRDGTIEADISGNTAPDAPPEWRGFVGIAFRVSPDRARFECLYLRPKNGRSGDQLQRNHSTQYTSMPGFPWSKLRAENPGKYESYVDLVAGKWTHIKIHVAGSRAELYVNDSDQPTLIVNDLKQVSASGAVALWVGPGTIAHFSDLTVTSAGHEE
ncbi:MAG TPA: hypothetical protein VN025_18385 [Candidatus Dormibacteraeota bacterium]|jgi:hypothetical protein|nr:hypothetical protein [Candidatus Dormibacteraeota bacterium]